MSLYKLVQLYFVYEILGLHGSEDTDCGLKGYVV
jgi:hypothetical protein